MCIISKPVNKVTATKILVAIDESRTRQLIVYSNKIDNVSQANAMILPVPNPTSIKFHDLSNYDNIFADLSIAFRKQFIVSTNSFSYSSSSSSSSIRLPVFTVGSYKVCIANTLSDLKLVDSSVFELSEGCEETLKDYPQNFGFIICKLASGLEMYHPFGYSHEIIDEYSIFVPTKHYHAHAQSLEIFDRFRNAGPVHSSFDEEWEHDIYLYNVKGKMISDMSTYMGQYIWNKENPLKRKFDFAFDKCKLMEKHTINGNNKNVDIMLEVV